MHNRFDDRQISPLKNYHYNDDIKYTLQFCQWILKAIGMWPLLHKRTSRLEYIVSVFLLVISFSFMGFVLVPSGQYLLFQDISINAKVKVVGPVGFCLSATIKYCYLCLKFPAFGRCIDHLEKDWRKVQDPDHRNIMLKYATISRHLVTIGVIFLYSGGMSYHTVMQILSKDKNKKNSSMKPLSYPCFTFLDTQSSPTYEIVFFVHCLCAIVMYNATMAAYSLTAVFVTHICGQIQIQINRLDALVEKIREKTYYEDPLTTIVRDHANTLRLSKNVEAALSEICFTEIIQSTLTLCLLEYYCLTEWENSDMVAIFTYLTLLIFFTFNIFIFCYIGELLSEQCSQVGFAAYKIDWYNWPTKKAYDLILLSVISLYPPKLTAGKMIDLSLDTFSTVIKSSFFYFNLLRTFTTW